MELFRICRAEHAQALTSSGNAGRWNQKESLVIYTSSSRSLATLESIVNRGAITPNATYKVMVIILPDNDRLIRQVKSAEVPKDWRTLSAYPRLQEVGRRWYDSLDTLILKVPSVVIPQEYNFILNTRHPDFRGNVKLIRTEDYFFDRKLLAG